MQIWLLVSCRLWLFISNWAFVLNHVTKVAWKYSERFVTWRAELGSRSRHDTKLESKSLLTRKYKVTTESRAGWRRHRRGLTHWKKARRTCHWVIQVYLPWDIKPPWQNMKIQNIFKAWTGHSNCKKHWGGTNSHNIFSSPTLKRF